MLRRVGRVQEIILPFRPNYDIFPPIEPAKIFRGELGMIQRNDCQRYLCWFLFILFLSLIFGPLRAEETQLIRVRKGDTISYLSFKIYGKYDSKMAGLLRRENPQIKDIDLIYAGQELRFPAPEGIRKKLGEKPAPPSVPGGTERKEGPLLKETSSKEESMDRTQVRANKGVITYLEGQVQVKKSGETEWSAARPNMILSEKDQIRVQAKSRAELILDNQSVMRLSENTLLTIHKLEEEVATRKETTRVELSLGKLWTRTAKLFNPTSRYDIRTPTAIAGVQGTIYQLQVGEDRETNIQVFQGTVNVYNPFPAAKPSQPGQVTQWEKPQEVTGPGEVPGPASISREEWTKIVLRQYQQITVTDRGIPRPTSFNAHKERQNEWVRWNEERDADFLPPERPR